MIVSPISVKNISSKAFAYPKSPSMPSVFAEFERDSFVRQPVEQIVNTKKSVDKKKILATVGILGAIAVGVALACVNKKSINKNLDLNELKNSAKKLDALFPQDAKYRNKIAEAVGLDVGDSYKLSSIVGAEEFTKVAKEFEQNPEVFSPGTPNYSYFDSVSSFNNENLANGVFGANLHSHTENSDGVLSVKEFLDKCVEYADRRFEKVKKPFYVAITDHDTVNGCKEAVEIISKEPKKFKNLKLILGIENTFVYKNPELLHEDANIHVLSYGINPYSPQIDGIIGKKMEKNISNIRSSLGAANKTFMATLLKEDVEYSFEDMTKISKSIGVGIKNVTYYLKDYLQFKYIFAKNVLKNPELCEVLSSANVKLSDVDYAKPIKLIDKKPDYSKGQKYYDYYYKATKEYIVSLVDDSKKDKVEKLFKPFTLQDRLFLQKLEDKALDPASDIYVKSNEFFEFGEGVSKLAELSDGLIGMAHPGVMFPVDALKYKSRLTDMYEDLYSIFKKNGGDKALFVEDNYQAYYKTNKGEFCDKLREISSKYGFIRTGGLDTHGSDIASV